MFERTAVEFVAAIFAVVSGVATQRRIDALATETPEVDVSVARRKIYC